MTIRYYLPGFGLKAAIYKTIDPTQNARHLETPSANSFEECIDLINSSATGPGIMVGYSQGARLALSSALGNDNVKGLVLISAHLGLIGEEKDNRKVEDQKMAELCRSNPSQMYDELDSKSVFDVAADLKDYRINDVNILSNQLNVLGLGNSPYLEDQLINLRIPVLYLTGSRDQKYTTLAMKYKKKTAFAHHRVLDSDHRIVVNSPRVLKLCVDWFVDNVVDC